MQTDSYIDQHTCGQCGLCAAVCPNKIIERTKTEVAFRSDRLHLCIHCGHCMAICPTESVHVESLSYDDFFDLSGKDFDAEAFFHWIATRRSIRAFRDESVPRELLQQIVDAVSEAPMGFPPHKTKITIVSDRRILEKAVPLFTQFYEDLVKWMNNPLMRFFIRRKLTEEKYNTIANHVLPVMETRLPDMKERREDLITRNAPALLLFHADRGSENHSEDVWIALAYGLLAAHALGLGATAIGLVPPAVEQNQALRSLFQIPEGDEVLASMIVGYPRHRFRKGIKRNLAEVKWLC